MPDEASALAVEPAAVPSEDDYRAFSDALSESARGRAFLAEYARRNRSADTELLLAALARLEGRIAADASAETRLRDELRVLLIAIRVARPDIDATLGPAKAVKLVALLDQLERRIEAIAEGKASPPAAAPESDMSRPPLSVVPSPDEPELPIPSPAAQPPAMALVARSTAIPEVAWFERSEPAPPAPSPEQAAVTPSAIAVAVEAAIAAAEASKAAEADAMPAVKIIKAGTMPPPAPFAGEDFAAPPPRVPSAAPSADPLAAVMALSEEERIALFT